MINLILIAAGLWIISVLMAVFYIRSLKSRIKSWFSRELGPKGENPSEFLRLTDAATKLAIHNAMASLKANNAAVAAGEAKREKAIQGIITQDIMSQMGGLPGLMAQLPGTKKALAKYPGMAPYALQFLGQLLNKNPIEPGQPSGNGSEVVDNFSLTNF